MGMMLPFNRAEDAGPLSVALTYLDSHAELYDGPGSGLLFYQPSKRDAAARFFDPN
jgi:hypothetical protein